MTAIVKASGEVLDVAGIVPRDFNDVARISAALAKARGFVPDAYIGNSPALAAAIMTGLELGIGPMQAIRSISIVKGKPVLDASLMLALAIRGGVRQQWIESSDTRAVLRLTRAGFEPHEQRYTIDDAKRAGLGNKDNYRAHPAAMLRARCLSAAVRAYCPDVLGSAVYVEGELGGDSREPIAAEIVDVETGEVHEAPQSIEEASCGGTSAVQESAVKAERSPTKSEQLADQQDELQLAAWIRRRRRGLRAAPDKLVQVVEHADKIGIGNPTAWVDAQLAESAA